MELIMRKNLLASAAALCGLFYSGLASAQSVTAPSLLPDARALAGGVNPVDANVPAPGNVVVRFGGQMDWYAVTVTDSAQRTRPGSAVIGKESDTSFGDYIRLFPSVDGQAANGLRYGAFSELRVENFIGAGGGATGSVSGQDRSNTLYVRRAWGYLGLPQIGTIRFGTGDGASGLFDTGTFQNFDAGGWDGDIENLIDSNAQPIFPFIGGEGAFYATNKLTYLSPQIYGGLEFGLSYEPNTDAVTDYGSAGNAGTLAQIPGSTTGGGLQSPLADSSSIAGDIHRRRNVINPEFRYRHTFGPVGVALEGGYMKSGTVSFDGLPNSSIQKFKGWDFSDWGVVLTFGGLSVGGHIMDGAFNGSGALAPQGTKDSFAYLVGGSYTVGPLIVGASFFQFNSPGNSGSTTALASVGQERDRGIAAGGTYTLTPGVSLFLSYLYGDKKESGFDLIDGAVSTPATGTFGNATRAQALGTGIQIKW
jgi:outer membrane protein OmpU